MAASRWDPFKELAGLHERLDSMLRDFDRTWTDPTFISSQWTPPVDILDAGDLFVIKMEVPEVDKESIDIAIEGRQLTITGRENWRKVRQASSISKWREGTARLPVHSHSRRQ